MSISDAKRPWASWRLTCLDRPTEACMGLILWIWRNGWLLEARIATCRDLSGKGAPSWTAEYAGISAVIGSWVHLVLTWVSNDTWTPCLGDSSLPAFRRPPSPRRELLSAAVHRGASWSVHTTVQYASRPAAPPPTGRTISALTQEQGEPPRSWNTGSEPLSSTRSAQKGEGWKLWILTSPQRMCRKYALQLSEWFLKRTGVRKHRWMEQAVMPLCAEDITPRRRFLELLEDLRMQRGFSVWAVFFPFPP